MSDVVVKQGDTYPPLRFADTNTHTPLDLGSVRVGYIATLPNRCVVRGELKVLDSQAGAVEPTPSTLPAGTEIVLEVVWPNAIVETLSDKIVVAS